MKESARLIVPSQAKSPPEWRSHWDVKENGLLAGANNIPLRILSAPPNAAPPSDSTTMAAAHPGRAQRRYRTISLMADVDSTPPASPISTSVGSEGSAHQEDWASELDPGEQNIGCPGARPNSPIEGFEGLRTAEALAALVSSSRQRAEELGVRGYPVCKGCEGTGRGRAFFSTESLVQHPSAGWQKEAIQATARVSMLAVDPREMSTWALVDIPSRPIGTGDFISIQLREDGKVKPSIFCLAVVTAIRMDERHWREFVIQASVGEGGKAYLQVPWRWCARNAFEKLHHWIRAPFLLDTISPLDPATLSQTFPASRCRTRIILVECRGPEAEIELVEVRESEWYAGEETHTLTS